MNRRNPICILMSYLRCGDIAVIVFLLALLTWSFTTLWGRPKGSVVVSESDDGRQIFSLAEDKGFEIEGPLGITVVEIKAGKVRIVSSPCSAKTCVKMGSAWREGQVLVCVPNRIVLRIEGGLGDDGRSPDAITR